MPEMPRACLPAELFREDRKAAARQAVKDRPDNAPSFRARQELAGVQPEGAVFLTGALWPQKRRIDVSFLGVGDSDQDKIRHDLEELYGYTNLGLRWVKDGGEIRIAVQPGGSWSYMGSQCLQVRSGPTMSFGWLDDGVVFHEGGHSLGMGHGHKNPKTPWQWDRDAVIRDLSGPPNNWSVEQIEHNVLSRYASEEVTASDPDYDSVMAYRVPNSWTVGDYEVATNDDLSAGDVAWLRKMYPADEPTEPEEPEMQHLLVIQGKGPLVRYSVLLSGPAKYTERAGASIQDSDSVLALEDGCYLARGAVSGAKDAIEFDGRVLSCNSGDGRVTFVEHREIGS